jgi:MbtH protein
LPSFLAKRGREVQFPGRMSDSSAEAKYKVVVNHEEQYSIWPDWKELPPGWRYGEKTGTKEECLAHIKEVWTDMRPLSLRKAMEAQAGAPKQA